MTRKLDADLLHEAARFLGRKGGQSRSPQKIAASRRNAKLAVGKGGGHKMSRRLCKRCHEKRLAVSNRSGVCTACQRNPSRVSNLAQN